MNVPQLFTTALDLSMMRSDARRKDAVRALHGSSRKLSYEGTSVRHEQLSHRGQETTMESCARGNFLHSQRLSRSMSWA